MSNLGSKDFKIEDFYRVESFEDLFGNSEAISKVRMFAAEIKAGKKRRPLLLYGPSGTGKTSLVLLLARIEGWNVIEFNASDYRDKDSITMKLLPASTSSTLFGNKNIIFMDEIDELATRFDKGANSAIIELIEKSKHPIIFTANDRWSQKISFLRDKVDYVEFKKLGKLELENLINHICKKFGAEISKDNVEVIVQMSNGDARSAINDLFAVLGSTEDAYDIIGIRDRKIDVFNLLDHIFLANSFAGPLRALASTDLENDMVMNWIEENIPARYLYDKDLAKGLDMLSYASLFYNLASKSQYYTYWRYANAFMASGVALAKTRTASVSQRYAFPRIIKQLSGTKASRNQALSIASKLQRVLHSSRRRLVHYEMKVLAQLIRKEIEAGATKDNIYDLMEYSYGLAKAETEFLASY
ncbi:MAG: replication factor C large subunit [Candidatus Micrarchaeia archaeon]